MLKPAYALVGTDAFQQLEQLASLLRDAGDDVQRIDLDGEKAELAEVLDELRTFTMFASSKMVVMRNAADFLTRFREPLEEYLAKGSVTGTLILRLESLPATQRIYKTIKKVGQVIDCNPPRDLAKWATERAKSTHAASIAPEAARQLAEMIGDDLGRLDNELAKLALMSDGKITLAAVNTGVTFQRDQEMYDMTNEVVAGRTAEAVRRWRQLVQLDPSTEYRAVVWLTMWLEDVRTFLFTPGAFKNMWKYKDTFAVFKRSAESIGRANIGRLIELLAEVDFHSKTGIGEMADNVERFLIAASTPH